MPRVDWSSYAEEQLRWAECLIAIADEAGEEEGSSLRRKAEATLIEATDKLGIALHAARAAARD